MVYSHSYRISSRILSTATDSTQQVEIWQVFPDTNMSEAEGKEQASGGRLTAKAIAPKIRSCHEALKQTKKGIAMQADRSFRRCSRVSPALSQGCCSDRRDFELASSRQPAGTKPADPFSMQARLGANLYIQTAAEYRACCLQVYKTAEIRLEALLAAANPKPLKPAVIMDLDETVLDNSAFESFLYENNVEYSDDLWEIYERDYPGAVRLVPGAQQFIKKAEERGVTVIFISNRLEENCGSTANALQRLGINTKGIEQRLLLKKKGASSDKTSRREMAAAQYNVLLVFGDNLRDFSETFIAGKLTANDGRRRLQ